MKSLIVVGIILIFFFITTTTLAYTTCYPALPNRHGVCGASVYRQCDKLRLDVKRQAAECFDGVCSCFKKKDYVPPRNLGLCTETKGDCYSDCKKRVTSHIRLIGAYLCNDFCFCNLHRENLNLCRNDYDCGIDCDVLGAATGDAKKCRKKAPRNVTKDTRCDGIARCVDGFCKCEGSSLGTNGRLSSTACELEQYCENFCGLKPDTEYKEAYIGKACRRVVNGIAYTNCFCPKNFEGYVG